MATKDIEIHALLAKQVEELIVGTAAYLTDSHEGDPKENVRLEASLRRAVANHLLDWAKTMEVALGEERQ